MTDTESIIFDPKDLSDVPEPERRMELLARHIDDCYSEFSQSAYRKKVLDRIETGRKKYEQEFETVTDPWKGSCGLVGPITAITVDTLEPKLWQSIVGQDEIVRADSPDEDPELNLVMAYDNYWMVNEVKIKRKAGDAVHDLALDGTVYLMGQWVRQETTRRDFVRQPDPNTGEERGGPFAIAPDGSLPTEDFVVPEYEGGELTHLCFSEVYLPDDVNDEDWDTCPLIRPVSYTYAELKRFQAQGILGWQNIDEELRSRVSQRKDELLSPAQKAQKAQFSKTDKGIPCLEFHGEFDIDGVGIPKRIVAVKPDGMVNKIIRLVDQLDLDFRNKKSITRMRIFPEKGLSYGRGLAHIVAGLQRVFDETIRRIFNAADMQIDPFGIGDIQSAGFKDQKPTIKPGGWIDCKNPDQVKFVQFPGDATRFLVLIELINSFLERMISAPDYTSASKDAMGVKNSMGTATGTVALLSEGNLKHDYKGRRLQEQWLEVCEMLHALYYQNMPLVKKFGMMGQAIEKHQMGITPKFALVSASSSSNKFIDRQTTMEMLKAVDDVGLAPMVNPAKALEDLLEAYDKKDIEEWIIDPAIAPLIGLLVKDPGIREAFKGLVQQRMMAAQAQQQMAGGAPPGPEGPQVQPGMAA